MPEERDPVEPKAKPVKVGLLVSAEQHEAMEFVKRIHGDKYDGIASVLNDYSVSQCVEIREKARSEVAA